MSGIGQNEELGGVSVTQAIAIVDSYIPPAGTTPSDPSLISQQTSVSAFDDALLSLSLIEAEYDGIEIMAAIPNQAYDDTDTLTDTVDISYRIIGRPGVYTASVPYAINWQAIAFFVVGLQANTIELIYEGASSLNQTPTVYLTTPPTPPSVNNTYYEWELVNGVLTLVPVQGEPIPTPGHPIYQ